ncbi:flagellar export chaperone FliS [Dongshaea marina]|uniref:flagellar export chaperone FliS n=1 Tax=Dongshaea marina TaxID=2047966 RepID=UPI000D3EC9A3|nr:flagellar export chaperone FliS [Dongshaea marina]
MTRSSIKKYQQSSVSNVADADPHTLISIIFQHIINNNTIAKGAMEREDIEARTKAIDKSIALIGELQDSLDMEQGGEVSQNLAALYDYCVRRLVESNAKIEPAMLDEVSKLIAEVKEGWDAIPQEARDQHATKQAKPED